MTHETLGTVVNTRRQTNWQRPARVLAGLLLSLLGAAGLGVTILATFARGPFDRPLLLLGIGSALLFTGGGICLLLVGAALMLGVPGRGR